MSLPREMYELDFETGEVIRTFKSMRELADFHNTDSNTVRNVIKLKNGFMNKRKLRFAYVGIQNVVKPIKIRQVDYYTGEEIEVYNSLQAAAEDNFITANTLRDALRTKNGCMNIKKLKFEYVN